MDEGDDRGRTLVTAALLGGAGYLGYRLYVQEKLKAALYAEAQAQLAKNPGMSIKDAMTNAAAGACTAVAAVYKVPPSAGAPMCQGLAVVATKAVELAGKGAIIAGKAIGKGTVAATKAVGHAGAVVGKGVATGAKAVAYTAPKAVIGGTVNTADKYLSKLATTVLPTKLISKITPKPIKQVATVTKKVVKKVLCLGIFCGLDGLQDVGELAYRDQVEGALGRRGRPGRNPLRNVQRARAPRQLGALPSPFVVMARSQGPAVGAAALPRVRVAGRSRPGRQGRGGVDGAAFYEGLLGR
ncbi:MAG: hypothetical protein ABIR60_08630 [Allosphingosinicella sp.]